MNKINRKNIFHQCGQKEGFTLIELLIGMTLTTVVAGLALQALVRTQASFNNDQKKVANTQKMSSVLEVVGREIKQAGELIVESNFPIIQVKSLNAGADKGASIIIYRALSEPVSICQDYVANTAITSLFFATDKNVPTAGVDNNESKQYCTVDPGVAPNLAISGTDTLPLKQQKGWVNQRNLASNQKALGILYYVPDRSIQSFIYTGEGAPAFTPSGSLNLKIDIASFTPSKKINFGDTAYLVEKKEYLICGTELKVRTNSVVESNDSVANPACNTPDSSDPTATLETVATNIRKMDVTMTTRLVATTADPSPAKVVNSVNATFPIVDSTTPSNNRGWQNIQGVNIKIISIDPFDRNFASLSANDQAKISAEGSFYPRNVLSSK
jgi:prepilin-type N-terminal cleavage/methylation domain-containing protein